MPEVAQSCTRLEIDLRGGVLAQECDQGAEKSSYGGLASRIALCKQP